VYDLNGEISLLTYPIQNVKILVQLMGCGNMRKLDDKETGLLWLIPDKKGEMFCSGDFVVDFMSNIDDTRMLEEFRKELNQYHSESITRFVTGNCENLGDSVLWSAFDERYPCFCFDSGKLVATAIISPNNSLSKKTQIRSYIEYCKKHSCFTLNDLTEYLSYKQAQQILKKATPRNNTDIDYLVVVPPAQNKGVGTRAVRSITHNMDFFAAESPVSTIYTQIHKDNKPSQAIFRKENFKIYTMPELQPNCSLDDFVRAL
jgi:RimJ/RimL family protein N-acetyltransferase